MSKILFVCYGNVGRSQMAEAFYNHFTKSTDAFSAGTDSDTPQKYPILPDKIIDVMSEEGIDVSQQKVKLVNQDFVDQADQIYILCKEELCPSFLKDSDKITYWKIADPYQMTVDQTREIRNQIKAKIKSII